MGADLRGVNMSHALLRGAVLSGADLRDTILTGTDFRYADLRGASLEGASVDGDTNFLDAKVDADYFKYVDATLIRRDHRPTALQTK
jgi:uncharacterized protein YjbI with pentapeptide repeats